MRKFMFDLARLFLPDRLTALVGSIALWQDSFYKEDSRGWAELRTDNGVKIKKVFTRRGYMRGGEYHPRHIKRVWVIQGSLKINLYNDDKSVRVIQLSPHSEPFVIPKGVVHDFSYPVDSLIEETWPGRYWVKFDKRRRKKVKSAKPNTSRTYLR